MSGKRYSEEFKLEAIKQISERGFKARDVTDLLGVITKSLSDWQKNMTTRATSIRPLQLSKTNYAA